MWFICVKVVVIHLFELPIEIKHKVWEEQKRDKRVYLHLR